MICILLATLTTLWSYEETDLELDGNPSYYHEAGSPNALTSPSVTLGNTEFTGEIASSLQLPAVPENMKVGLVWVKNTSENAFYGLALQGRDTTNTWAKLTDVEYFGSGEVEEVAVKMTLSKVGNLGIAHYELTEQDAQLPLFCVEYPAALHDPPGISAESAVQRIGDHKIAVDVDDEFAGIDRIVREDDLVARSRIVNHHVVAVCKGAKFAVNDPVAVGERPKSPFRARPVLTAVHYRNKRLHARKVHIANATRSCRGDPSRFDLERLHRKRT